MKRCLILGGAGFLGINLCKALLQQGISVSIYNRKSPGLERFKKLYPNVQVISRDFVGDQNFSAWLENVDVVFHLVSTTNPSNKDVLYEFETNVIPTIRLLDICATKGKRLIYFSSGGTVYGVPQYVPIDEGHRTEPISAYGIHKLSVEKCIEYYGRTYGMDYRILRISNPYGTHQNPQSDQGVIAVFLANALLGRCLDVWGDGTVVRDYIYVDDVMRICLKILGYQGESRIFNVGSGIGHSTNEIIDIIKTKLNSKIKVSYLPGRIQDVPVNILDTALVHRELNWQPEYDLEKGIQRMIETWNPNRKEFCVE